MGLKVIRIGRMNEIKRNYDSSWLRHGYWLQQCILLKRIYAMRI